MIFSRKPYTGKAQKLVLAFDVGTTFSGISFSILEPGVIPEVRPITRYPEQEHVGGDAKIPSILYYDPQGNVQAAGAEALQGEIEQKAEENNWFLSRWFKLHLKPMKDSVADSDHPSRSIPSLPPNKSAVDVFADFLRYLFHCSKKYIMETVPDPSFWSSIENNIDFVLTHPNGWEGPQQYHMRRAAISAGLISDSPEDHSRLTFVTEGEACLHFCVHNRLSVSSEESVVIIDAGGGTIDLSTYSSSTVEDAGAVKFEEVTAPQCLFAGSIFVTKQAKKYLDGKLQGTRFINDVDHIVAEFDKITKLRFKDSGQTSYIKFGSFHDNDPTLKIRSGQMSLPGADVEQFFEPSLMSLLHALDQQIGATKERQPIKSVFIVGGFAASEWLYVKVATYLRAQGITLCRPHSNLNKATADGGVSFYLDRCVSARVARWTYGTSCGIPFKQNDPEHISRKNTVYQMYSGGRYVPSSFSNILSKGTQVSENTEFRASFFRESRTRGGLSNTPATILCYQGTSNPLWIDVESDCYRSLCKVKADTSSLAKNIGHFVSSDGSIYFELNYDVVLHFGLTELRAQIAWKENGVEKRCPGEIIYDAE